MEGNPETNGTQNFEHQSGSRSTVKNALKIVNTHAFNLKKTAVCSQQHFSQDIGLGCLQSQCSVLPGEPETGSSWGTKNRVLFWRANTRFKLAAAVFGESCDQRVCPPVRFNSNSMCQKNLKQLTMNGNSR